jgi:hypothetical protein
MLRAIVLGEKTETCPVVRNKNMTPEAIVLLQQSIGKMVRLTRPDGEVILAKVIIVDPLDEEIVFNMLSTSEESKYEKFDREPAYLLYFNDISTVNAVTDSTS